MVMEKPAIEGGKPVRKDILPYGFHWIDESDINLVAEVLRKKWITCGSTVDLFEKKLARFLGAKEAVAVSSGTAALDLAVRVLDMSAGSEAITTPLTFIATPNSILYNNCRPVFADVEERTMLISPAEIRKKITKKTGAILPVHIAGQPCDMDEIGEIAEKNGLGVVEDAAHAFGAEYRARKVGCISKLTCFSMHPVKHITTGEGGIITTCDSALAERLRSLRSHGVDKNIRETKSGKGRLFYDMRELGRNYRLTDFQAALGLGQLRKIKMFLQRRERYAKLYSRELAGIQGIEVPFVKPDVKHAWHLYIVRVKPELGIGRDGFIKALRAENIGVAFHYPLVFHHSFYSKNFRYRQGDFPLAEKACSEALTLPLFPKMTKEDVRGVIDAVRKVAEYYGGRA